MLVDPTPPQIKPWEDFMDYSMFWLVIYAKRNFLIDRDEFIQHWGNVQELNRLKEEAESK